MVNQTRDLVYRCYLTHNSMIYYYDYLNKQRIDNPTQIGLK